ncbi:MAG TPA: hypothetical protein VLN26_12070 [Gaiellaceae bacterium]|nr:hypothetical protein [Gaiellaceae bacterium]
MRLYVCWGTWKRPGVGRPDHPCGTAYHALRDAGYEPEVVRSYGWRVLPRVFNRMRGRRDAEELTGSPDVPVLVTDDGHVVAGSEAIRAFAAARSRASGAARSRPPQSGR